MNSDNLPPIDLKEDIEKYQAQSFTTNIEFKGCKHKNTSFNDTRTELRCKCGAAWFGSRLGELKKLLDNS